MKLLDLLITSWRMVYRNRIRYRAVIIAIALGTIGFIMIRTLGNSVEKKVSDDLELIGEATVLTVRWYDRKTPYHLGEYFFRDCAKLRDLPNVTIVAPVRKTGRTQTVQYGRNKRTMTEITAIDENFWLTQSTGIQTGRFINANDVAQRNRVCIVGKDVLVDLSLASDNPVGKKISINSHTYDIIGKLKGVQPDDVAKSVFIPISVAHHHFSHLRQIEEFLVRVDKWENVKAVKTQVDKFLKKAHPLYTDGVKVEFRANRLNRVNFVVFMVKMFTYAALIGIFILGKVGLTSVILSAIESRIREIGIRKAVGASDRVIRAQFLIEAVLVSVSAGIIGAIGGVIIVQLLRDYLGVEISRYVMSMSILLDLSFTTLIGVAAGLYPSLRASRLDIVSAIRFE